MNMKNALKSNAIWLVFAIEVVFFAIFSHGSSIFPDRFPITVSRPSV